MNEMSGLAVKTSKVNPAIETADADAFVSSTSKLLPVEPATTSLNGDNETINSSACAGVAAIAHTATAAANGSTP